MELEVEENRVSALNQRGHNGGSGGYIKFQTNLEPLALHVEPLDKFERFGCRWKIESNNQAITGRVASMVSCGVNRRIGIGIHASILAVSTGGDGCCFGIDFRPVQLGRLRALDPVEANPSDSVASEAQCMRGGIGQIDDASRNNRTAIIHAHHDCALVGQVGNSHESTNR